jgi:L-ascorbate metabolism protein UlaG (beta-lactamase superfamily)
MKIEWIGHACFSLTSQKGLKIITDPYEPEFRNMLHYRPINEHADIVTVSHGHGDHNYISAITGKPTIVNTAGTTPVKGIQFKGISVYHDRVQGAQRGKNLMFMFNVDNIRLAHLGDLGHQLSADELRELEDVEVLFAPTGGPAATLELQEIIDLWEKVKPRVVIPMHFKTERCGFPKYSAEDLLRLRPAAKTVGTSELILTREKLPSATEILIMNPSH